MNETFKLEPTAPRMADFEDEDKAKVRHVGHLTFIVILTKIEKREKKKIKQS